MYSKYIKGIHQIGDYLLLNAAFLLAYAIRISNFSLFTSLHYFEFLLFFNIAWGLTAYLLDTYNFQRTTGYENIFRSLIKQVLFHLLLVAAFVGLTKNFYSRLVLIYAYSFLIAAIPIWRLMFVFFLKQYRKKGFNFRRVAIVGKSESSLEIEQYFKNHPEHGYRFLGYFESQIEANDDNSKIENIETFIVENQLDELYCTLGYLSPSVLQELIEISENNLVRIKLLPESRGINISKMKVDLYDHLPVLTIRPLPLDDPMNRFIKRLFDIVFSSIVILTILWWLIPILAIFIKLDSKGAVFFKQKRSGLKNDDFWCYKLRSMSLHETADSLQASKNDFRVTKVGSFLRKTSLDELPQFLNVFMGQMSVVGPRPHMVKHTEEYSRVINKYMVRHLVKPGITGLSQVKGYRGETNEPYQMRNRIRIDIFYLENWSFLLDIKVIYLTVLNALKGDQKAY